MFCRLCNAELTEDMAVCPQCHAPVSPSDRLDTSSLNQPAAPAALPPGASAGAAPDHFGDPALQFSPIPPVKPPLLERLFGPGSRVGTPPTYSNSLQRRLLRRLPAPLAGNVFFGALIGPIIAILCVLLLILLASLVFGPLLDQALNTALAAELGSQAKALPATIYANPLQLFASAEHTTLNEQVTITGSPLVTTASVDSPVTLLLILPALGLILGGYVAGSTNTAGRRLHSVTRGASISLLYALFALFLSLETSSSLVIAGLGGTSGSIILTPDAFSAFLNGLLWGLLFGAAGGWLSGRALPKVPQTHPASPEGTRLRAALIGGGAALAAFFALCLVLVLSLYGLSQAGAKLPHLEGALTVGSTSIPCSQYLGASQPFAAQGSATSAQPAPSGFNTTLLVLLSSPSTALLLMQGSMGVSLDLSVSAPTTSISQSIGLLGGDCAPGADGALFYALFLLPAIAFFVGGWVSEGAARDRTILHAAGTGLMLALVMGVLLDLLTFLATTSITIKVFGIAVSSSFGPSLGGALLAGGVFGATFGVLGSVLRRLLHPPQPQPALVEAAAILPGKYDQTS